MKVLFVVNPVAGGGRCLRAWQRLVSRHPHLARDAEFTEGPGHGEKIAATYREKGYDGVVAVGGDGTLHEVVNGAVAAEPVPTVGILPCGTGNDFARSFRLPREPEEALRACTGGTTALIDLGRLNGRLFINVAGFGFDAAVAEEVTRRAQQGAKATGTIPYLMAVFRLLRRYRPQRITIKADGRSVDSLVLFGAIGNGSTYGGGMKVCPTALVDDGGLDLCLAHDLTIPETLVNLVRVFRGTHLKEPKVSYERVRRVEVIGDPAIRVHADGQLLGTLPVEIEVVPKAVRFLIPSERA